MLVIGILSNSLVFLANKLQRFDRYMPAKINPRIVVLIAIFFLSMLGIYAARGLYADGSYILYELLSKGRFANLEGPRKLSQAVTQVPVWIAMQFGVVDLNLLIRLHSVGTCGFAVWLWCWALLLHFRSSLFWIFVFGFSVTYLSFGFFAHGEANITCALTALASAIILRARINWFEGIVLLIAATVLLYAYQTLVGLGPLLFAFTLGRLCLNTTDTKFTKLVLVIAGVLFLIATYNAAWSLRYSGIQDMGSALNLGAVTSFHFMYITLMAALICTAYLKQRMLIILLTVFTGIGLSVVYLISPKLWNPPFMMYSFRVLASPLLFGTLLIAGWLTWYETIYQTNGPKWSINKAVSALILAVFLSLSIPFVVANFGFVKWAQRFEQAALALTVNTPIEKTNINTDHGWNSGFNWMWNNPSTSILLRGDATAVIMNNSGHTGWQPFDPEKIDKNPLWRFVKSQPLY